MTAINPLINITHIVIEPCLFLLSCSNMDPVAVLYFRSSTERVVTHNGMLGVRIIIIQDNNLWGVIRGGQSTNRFSRGNIDGIWKRVRSIEGCFVWTGTIINGHGREIQSFLPPSAGKVLLNQS